MVDRLARHARRQLRLARDQHHLSQSSNQLVTHQEQPQGQPRQETLPYVDGEIDCLANSRVIFIVA